MVQRGMVQGTSWTFDGALAGQTFYWSVQAVDPSFGGSAFAAQGSFRTPPFAEVPAGLPGVAYSAVAWGDYDNDGWKDVLVAGQDDLVQGTRFTRIYRNDGNGAFHDIAAGLPGVLGASAAWGDYDRDGRLDILFTGAGLTKVYHNDGNHHFSEAASLAGLQLRHCGLGRLRQRRSARHSGHGQ